MHKDSHTSNKMRLLDSVVEVAPSRKCHLSFSLREMVMKSPVQFAVNATQATKRASIEIDAVERSQVEVT